MKEIYGQELFAVARGNMRVAMGIIFALFIICFIAIIIEETFLGGRRRRKAEKATRQSIVDSSSAEPHDKI
jgi:hypothetical protein